VRSCAHVLSRQSHLGGYPMNAIVYIVGLVVVVGAVIAFIT
jgi:hypothetical protein